MTDIVERLRSWCTDWNGAAMARGEPPHDGLHCDDLLDAADEIERLRKQLANRALAMREHADKIETHQLHTIRAATIEECERAARNVLEAGGSPSMILVAIRALAKEQK